jgi:hypothetical protein
LHPKIRGKIMSFNYQQEQAHNSPEKNAFAPFRQDYAYHAGTVVLRKSSPSVAVNFKFRTCSFEASVSVDGRPSHQFSGADHGSLNGKYEQAIGVIRRIKAGDFRDISECVQENRTWTYGPSGPEARDWQGRWPENAVAGEKLKAAFSGTHA